MPASKDPVKRQAQLANLKRGQPVHGASTEERVRPLRETYLAELRGELPNASERRLIVQAHRLAQMHLLGAFTDERGVIAHRRRGTVYPASALAERIASAFLAEQDRLEAQEREREGGGGAGLGDELDAARAAREGREARLVASPDAHAKSRRAVELLRDVGQIVEAEEA
jgi:hypothetical protein